MQTKNKNKKPLVLDLFSGCGGLSFGFEKAGFKILAGVDNWKDSLVTFEKNHSGSKGILMDLTKLDPKHIEKEIGGKIDVVIGGPPCQGFSISGKRNPNDPRNILYKGFVKTVAHFKPKAFVLENVPNIVSMADGAFKNRIIKDFSSLGYTVKYKILLASDFGVPQNRRRVVFVGLKNGSSFVFPEATHGEAHGLIPRVTTKDAIGDLPEKDLKDGSHYPCSPISEYQKVIRKNSGAVFNHQTVVHSEKTKMIIHLVPDGGNYKNLPKELQSTRKVNIAWTRYSSKKPSLTIDTGHNHHFHYKFDRVPTPREAARLQSFDDSFVFYGKKNDQLKQIGNAVPPVMAKKIAIELKKFL